MKRGTPGRGPGLVVFLGPSLAAAEARRLGAAEVLPPARQGDVWRALAWRPLALALVDGVFESTPSVWHHELLDALDAGVAVFGGASMGALRAAELGAHGMIGVGRIHEWYRRGVLRGDDEVALLHGEADTGYRPLTVPLVTVRVLAAEAAAEQRISRAEGARLVAAAASVFYQERTWPRVLAAAAARLRPEALARIQDRLRHRPPDPKADDARATIRAAAALVASLRERVPSRGRRWGAISGPSVATPSRRPSALVRRRKLIDGVTVVHVARSARGAPVPSGLVLEALRHASDATVLRDQGLRRALLASVARTLGLEADARERARAADALFSTFGVARGGRTAFLAASGLDDADAARVFDDLALERKLLDAAQAAVPDGPSSDEGLALGSRLAGRWQEIAAGIAAPRPPVRRGRRKRSTHR